ncbi:MAG: hypothetical protein ACK559_37725, partial [bacterium]
GPDDHPGGVRDHHEGDHPEAELDGADREAAGGGAAAGDAGGDAGPGEGAAGPGDQDGHLRGQRHLVHQAGEVGGVGEVDPRRRRPDQVPHGLDRADDDPAD